MIHVARVLAAVVTELVSLGRLSEDGAATILLLADPDTCWGSHHGDLRASIRQALAPRKFEREKLLAAARALDSPSHA